MEAIIHGYLTSFQTLVLLFVVAFTLYTLSKGADILVDEAVSLSLHWGISKMIIGATIVSLGTTLPEATVSVLAAVKGNPDLALGNAIGSIIVDTSLIIGLAAFVGNLTVDPVTIERQGKLQILAGILLAVVSLPFLSRGNTGNISQWMGIFFLILLATYIYVSMKWAKNSESNNMDLEEEKSSVIVQMLKLLFGITLVIGSSKVLIPAVEITAIRVGIPQSVIAATLVAFGTSLPELVTAITAVRKGYGELAIGNIVGADILNVLFVVGGAASVTKGGLDVPVNFYRLQIPFMLIALFTFRFLSKSKEKRISKAGGVVLFIIYISYLILNYI